MKLRKASILFVVLGLFMAASVTDVAAQSKADAIKAYNKAFELAKNEQYSQAIAAYVNTISICDKLGDEGKDIKEKAESKLPPLHFRQAASYYTDFKKNSDLSALDKAIDAFQETHDVAQKYGDSDIASRSKSFIPKLHYIKGIVLYQQQKYDQSLAALDKAIDISPDHQYAKAYYQKALILKKQDNLSDALDMYDQAIQIGMKNNDQQIVRKAKESARDELVYRGAEATKAKDYKESVDLLQRALQYDSESSKAYYRLAEAYNKQAMWDAALNASDKALKYESGSKTDRAKIYFEKGTALKNMGNKIAACEAFENAAYGSFKQPAEHQMEYELKCKTLSSNN